MTHAFKKCYHGHNPLPVGGDKVIYGGNGEHPVHDDGDVYVSLDHFTPTKRSMPWTVGHHFRYPITDGNAPVNHEEFEQLISWLSEQINAGMKVHVGCIGGHGRTGTVLAALVAHRVASGLLEMLDNDYIGYVRKNYCTKAVESMKQVDYLVEKWGAKTAPSSYSLRPVSSGKNYSTKGITDMFDDDYKSHYQKSSSKKPIYSSEGGGGSSKSSSSIDSGTPFRGVDTIWSKRVSSSVAMSK